MTPVVHITPELAPMVGGIADYAAILGGALAERGMAQSYLVAGHAASTHRKQIRERFPGAAVLEAAGPEELLRGLDLLGAQTVLLHYSGYGYARRGAPVWLVRGLERWKRRRRQHRLVVMFHESWAFGPVWRSSFWLSRLQRHCVARTARVADAVVPSNGFYCARLELFLCTGTPIRVEPIFSNVGEPGEVPPFDQRERVCVLFGCGSHRRRIYERFRPYLDGLAELGMARIVELGSEPEATEALKWPLPVDRVGATPAAEVSAMMLKAGYGLFECPVQLAGKSGVLAALAAHGVVPVHPDGYGSFDGLAFDRATICLANVPSASQRNRTLATVVAAVRAWYREHSLERQISATWLPLLLPR